MRARPWSTPAWRTARASTRLFRRSRSTVRSCRSGAERLTINDLIQFNSIPPQMAEVAAACVKSRLNMIVSGGTGAGKTTLLNCLSNYIPENERIVTIEDSAELKLQQEHVVRLETRPPNIEGQGAVTARDLVRNAL